MRRATAGLGRRRTPCVAQRSGGVLAHALAAGDGFTDRHLGQTGEGSRTVGQIAAHGIERAGRLPGKRPQATALVGLGKVDLLADRVLQERTVGLDQSRCFCKVPLASPTAPRPSREQAPVGACLFVPGMVQSMRS